MPSLSHGNLMIDQRRHGADAIRLDWKGRSDARRPDEAISPYLLNVLADAQTSGSRIEMRFSALDYLNSSTVAVLVQFVHRARAAKVHLQFRYKASVRWQKLSFEALRVFEQFDALIQVVPEAEA